MYPSVIRSLNVSPETKIGKVEGWNEEQFLKSTNNKTYSVMNKQYCELMTFSFNSLRSP